MEIFEVAFAAVALAIFLIAAFALRRARRRKGSQNELMALQRLRAIAGCIFAMVIGIILLPKPLSDIHIGVLVLSIIIVTSLIHHYSRKSNI